ALGRIYSLDMEHCVAYVDRSASAGIGDRSGDVGDDRRLVEELLAGRSGIDGAHQVEMKVVALLGIVAIGESRYDDLAGAAAVERHRAKIKTSGRRGDQNRIA